MKRKKPKQRSKFILPFSITLAIVVPAGLFIIFSYLWIIADAKPVSANLQPISEPVPEQELVWEPPKQEEHAQLPEEEESEKEDHVYRKEAANRDRVTIAFAGDILFDPEYAIMVTLLQKGGDITKGIAPELLSQMQSADILMLNNEFPYSDRGEPIPEKAFTFRAKPSSVAYLEEMGVDIVSLANNHAYDYGEEALLDTLQTLKEAGIPYVGAGADIKEASSPVYFILNDMKIAFISATQIERLENPDTKGATETSPGVFRCLNGEKLLQTVAEAKEESDFVIVYVHWGTENEEETDWLQEKQAPELVEAGADLIIGDHPHILQRIELIQGVPVIYSLGNFWFNSKTIDTGLVKVTITDEGLQSFQFVPCLQSGCTTTLLTGQEKVRVLDEMRRMSENVEIDEDGYVNLKKTVDR